MQFIRLTLLLILLGIFPFHSPLSACSTFLYSKDSSLIVGHNLDEFYEVPGYLIANNRGLHKSSISWREVLHSEKKKNKRIHWVSKYGSITFNTGGAKEFPDGGMNEKGLVICEMSLGETKFTKDDSRVKMFMMQWIQYQLDNYASIEEVLQHIDEFELDGWGWHFFIADKAGNKLVLEFIDGKTIIYTGDDMPYPVLCNRQYADEIKQIETFKPYSGIKDLDLKTKEDKNRFALANFMMNERQFSTKASPVEYGFDILHQLNIQGITKWSIVYDIKNLKVHFKTVHNQKIKHLDLSKIDFSCQNNLSYYDMETPIIEGDISSKLQAYNALEIKESIKTLIKNSLKGQFFLKKILAKIKIRRGMMRYNEKVYCKLEE